MKKFPDGYWTITNIKRHAKECANYTEFRKKYPGGCSAALRLKISNDLGFVPLRRNNNFWTVEKILEAAKNCTSREDFRKKYSAASGKARKLNILDSIFPNVLRVNYWNEDTIRLHAKECETKKEFIKKYSGAMSTIKKLNIWDSLNFKEIGNDFKRCIYAIEFNDNTVYVGLTFNFKTRVRQHVAGTDPNSPVYKYILCNKKISFKTIQLTPYIDKKEAVKKEEEYLQSYKNNGWNVLNIAKTGGLGGTKQILTNEEILKIASKYKSRKDIVNSPDKNIYRLLCSRKILKLTNFTRAVRDPISEITRKKMSISRKNRIKLTKLREI